MSAMRPYGRGYRLALRDIQAAVELKGHEQNKIHSGYTGIFTAAFEVTCELRFFRQAKNSEVQYQPLIINKNSKDLLSASRSAYHFHNRDALFNGYVAGFKRGRKLYYQYLMK